MAGLVGDHVERRPDPGLLGHDAQPTRLEVLEGRDELLLGRQRGGRGSEGALALQGDRDTIAREPKIVYYPLPDGRIKLAAGWLIDACGWKGKTLGRAGVYEHQALVLVNRGTLGSCDNSVTGGEVMTLAAAIQTSVYERFGIRLEPEPIVV